MQNFNASLRVKAGILVMFLLRVALLNVVGLFLVTPILHGRPGNAAPAKPAAPSALTLRIASDSRIDLAWFDNSNNEEGFQIERRLSTSTVYTLIETLGPNFEVFSDTPVAGDAKYFYRIRAYNNEGFSNYSNIVSGTTPPAAPSGLTATPVSTKQINLVWSDNSNTEESYEIERRLATVEIYTRLATIGPNFQAFADSGLTQNTKYFYRLRAINAGGQSDYSAAVSVTTLPTPPKAPSQLTATTVNSAQINLTWQDKSDNETGFKIERKAPQSGGAYLQVALVGANVTSFASATLSPNTKYFYRVRAYNLGGESAFTNEASATTLPKTPGTPGNLTATTVSTTRINLAWQDHATNEDSFKIERGSASSPQAGSAGRFAPIATVGANVKKFADSSLAVNTMYFYRVRAFNLGGFSDYSNEASATTLPEKPAAPGNLTATTVSHTQIDLKWQDHAVNEDSFKIERQAGAAGKYVKIATLAADAKSFSDKNLAANTEYFYRLRAANRGGHSDYSNEASAKTFPNPPGAPGNLIATTIGNSRINLKWQDNATNEVGFQIERKKGATDAYLQIAIAGANVKQFADSSLLSNTLYFYRVRAFNTGNQTAYSNEAGATTLPDKPAAPGNLTATAVSNLQIDLAWQDNATNEDSFKIERKVGQTGNYVKIATLAADAKNFSDKNLTATTEYFYRLRAANRGGQSDYSNEAGAKTFPNPPGAPSNLIATAISNSRLNLAWRDHATNEEGFQIERKKGAVGVYGQIAIAAANTGQFADSSLASNTLYFYRVRAFNTGNHTDYSNDASATTLPDKPVAPGNLTATTISNTQIKLAWQDNATNEDSFKIERKVGAVGKYVKIAALGANVKEFLDRSLAANTEYFYRLAAANRGGQSDYSNEASAKTFPNPPATPGNVTATTVSHHRINLAWKDNANNEVGFKIERGSTGSPQTGSPDTFVEIAQVGANAVSFADTGLAGNTKYSYRIRAYNTGGPSAYSAVVSSTTLPGPPQAPSHLIATVVIHNRINLAWQDNATNEAGFRVERKIGATGKYEEIIAVGVNATSYANTGLKEKTPYFYRVRAYNAGGYSDYSNVLEATTPPIAPGTPGNLAATTVSNTQINLTWQDRSANEDSFEIERKMGATGTYAELAKVDANVTSYSDKNLAGNTTYFYRVRAFNAGGHSDYSNEASNTTLPNPPAAPGNLVAVTLSRKQINLTWQDKSSNEDSFKIERKLGETGQYAVIAGVGANVKNFPDSSLAVNTPYFYRVRAFNRGGFSDYSNEARAVTLPLVPTTPRKLIANTVSATHIKLTWADSTSNEAGFEIERRLGPAAAYTKIATVAANTGSYADDNLDVNTLYFYRVRAFNTGGYSSYSNEAKATTLPSPPVAPGALIATTVSNTQINLKWQDNSVNEDSFKIEHKLGAQGAYKQIAALRANAKSFADTALTANTPYFYRVRAYNRGGHSGYSNEANAATLPNRPEAPANLTATTVSNTQINLQWQDNSTNEDSFKIERRMSGSAGSPDAYAEVAKTGPNVTSYFDNSLAANTTFFYRVRTVNAGGHSSYSNEANATTLPNLSDTPSQLSATAVSNKQIDLKWQDNSTNEDSFKVERGSAGSPTGTFKQIAVLRANANSFADTTLAANTPYFYRVRAYNLAGHSDYSNETNATTLPNRPGAPANLTAKTVSNKRIDLAWQDNGSNEDGFKIERRMKATEAYQEVTKTGPNVTSYSDNGLAANTTFFYRVRAFNAGGHSNYTNEANATTLPNLPGTPSQLTATAISNTQIDLKWQDNSASEDSFKVERGSTSSPQGSPAGPFKQIAVLRANANSFADTALAANTPYFYRVRSYNRAGHSDYSNEANAVTLPNRPGAPSNLTAKTVSNTRIDLAWLDKASNEDGFKIERKMSGSTGSPETYAEVAKVSPNVTSYVDNSASVNTTFFYRVRAFNAGGHSDYTNEAKATTLPNLPAAPGPLTATAVSNKQINLAWQDNAANEDSLKIERGSTSSPQGSPAGTFKQIVVLQANTKSFSDSALIANMPYFYRVRAYNRAGHSDYSNEANTATLPNRPGAPSNLISTTVSNTQINLKWRDNSVNEDSFKIERRIIETDVYIEVAKTGRNVTSYADNGVAANTTFFYRVRASNAGGHSNYTDEVIATTLPNLPGAPSQLTATPVSNKKIDLAWQDNSTDEDSFKIERKLGEAGAYRRIAALRANARSFVDTTLTARTSYFYRVRAYNRTGHSDYSNEANAMTLPNPPAGPNHLTATVVSNTRINLAWQDNAIAEAGFRIERKIAETDIYVEVAKVAPNVVSYFDNGLTANTVYFYRVSAYNAGGNSSYSNEANATTLPNPPANPERLIATAVSKKQIDLAWQDNSVDEDSFKIERGSASSPAGKYKLIAVLSANAMKFSDTGLAPNTLYFYRVRGYNRGGYSAYSNEASAATLPNAPVPPARLKATAISQAQINLVWADSAGNEVGYKIERKTRQGIYTPIDTVGANVKNYQDAGLTQNTEYFYRLIAYNAGGQSAPSNEANATTFPIPPKAPGNLTATVVSSSQADLAWADSSNNEIGFKIERRTLFGNFVEIATTGANGKSYSNVDLNSNTRYFYRVRAYNRGNHSAYSNIAEITTPVKAPTPPRNLFVTTRINLQIDLEWVDTSSGEDSFKIERKIGKTGAYVQIATVGKNAVNYSNINLQPVTQYFYRVRAVNTGGHSDYSNEAGAATLIRPPAAPKNLTATTVNHDKIHLAWADSSNNENGFQIDRKLNPNGAFVTIATLGPNAKSLVDSSLSGNMEYSYRIRAYNTGGPSGYSNEANAKTLIDPPARPANLTAAPESTTKIKLIWLDNSVNENGFQVERKIPQGGTTGTYALVATVDPNVKSFIDSSLAVNTAYFYRVRAFNTGGHSNYSNEASTRTLPNRPVAPNNLTLTIVSVRQLNLTWADISNNEAGFQIERKTGAAGVYGEIGVVVANAKRFADSTLAGKTSYFYRVRAYNAGGSSDYSNEASATTLPSVPVAPGNLTTASVSTRQIRLTWSDNSANESKFRIERRVTAASNYNAIATINADVTSFTDTGLVALTLYSYRIYAFNAGGNSNYSNEVSATTLPNPPAKPDSLSARAANHLRIDLQWKDLSDNEAGFQIERKVGAAGKFVQIASVGAGVTDFFDSNLAGNKEYIYRVRAFNAGGLSNYSNQVISIPLPVPPGSLTGGSLSNRRLYIAWTDSSNNESGFRIERRLFETEFVETGFVGANVRTYADSNLTPNTVYYYRVRAFNFSGLSAYSNEAPVATLPNAPAKPRGLNVKVLSNLRLKLTWTDSSNNEIGFAIERKLVADTAFAEVGIVDANVTAYSDTALAAESRYFYRVRAFNTGGYSPYSNEDNGVTLGVPPATPGELSATIGGSTKVNLLWQDFSNNESGFKIERKLVSDSVYAEIAAVGANLISYSDIAVTKDTGYMYRVRAFNEGGTSNYTNEASATPSSEINLAVGKPALASSAAVGATANRAVDGNLGTFWRSDTIAATKPQVWLRVELSPETQQIVIDRVVIRWHQNFFALAFEIQASENGSHWTTVYTTEAGKAGAQEIVFAQTPARFVRLYMKRNNKANYRVTEFEVYHGLAKASRAVSASAAIIPETVTLQPNYPNPFSANGTSGNPVTTISYALPEGMQVTLKVLNVAGQEVATLVERRQERGIYHVTFNARQLPSGVYFAILQAGEVRQVRQMLLAK